MAGQTLPKNQDASNDRFKDKLIRKLDCATLEFMHSIIEQQYFDDLKTYNYSIQICVRNMNCIKGFFIPRQEVKFP